LRTHRSKYIDKGTVRFFINMQYMRPWRPASHYLVLPQSYADVTEQANATRRQQGLLREGNNTVMHSIEFIHDLAVIMRIASVVTVLFHRLKQPVVLGYIVTGMIIGPHTPPSPLITDQHTINILAEVGVIFLMFSRGLAFSLRKLRVLMIWIGFEIGRHFGWKTTDALFLGAVMAEARALRNIERLIEPVRDMFSAIFFVTIGLMLDPCVLGDYLGPICGGQHRCDRRQDCRRERRQCYRRAGRVHLDAPRHEHGADRRGLIHHRHARHQPARQQRFSVSGSGRSVGDQPLLIRSADPLTKVMVRAMPRSLSRVFRFYTRWLQSLRLKGDQAVIAGMVRKILMQVFMNFCIVVALFLVTAYLLRDARIFAGWVSDLGIQKALGWGGTLLLSIPFLIAAYHKLKALSMMLAEVGVRRSFAGRNTDNMRSVVAEIIPALSLAVMLVLPSALSSSILPPAEMLVLVRVVGALVVVLLWRQFIKRHSRLQIALIDTFQKPPAEH